MVDHNDTMTNNHQQSTNNDNTYIMCHCWSSANTIAYAKIIAWHILWLMVGHLAEATSIHGTAPIPVSLTQSPKSAWLSVKFLHNWSRLVNSILLIVYFWPFTIIFVARKAKHHSNDTWCSAVPSVGGHRLPPQIGTVTWLVSGWFPGLLVVPLPAEPSTMIRRCL